MESSRARQTLHPLVHGEVASAEQLNSPKCNPRITTASNVNLTSFLHNKSFFLNKRKILYILV